MGDQSWKQAVESLAGTPPKPIVYRFNGGTPSQVAASRRRRKLPWGYFEEEKLHGAYKLNVVDGEIT